MKRLFVFTGSALLSLSMASGVTAADNGGKPDLVVVVTTPGYAYPGQTIYSNRDMTRRFRAQVRNNGKGDALAPTERKNVIVNLRLSRDTRFAGGGDGGERFSGDGVPLVNGRIEGSPPNAGGWNDFTVEATIPEDVPPGDYLLCAYVDVEDVVAETNEDNNKGCAILTIEGLPDLTIKIEGPEQAEAGQDISTDTTVTVTNVGAGPTPDKDFTGVAFDFFLWFSRADGVPFGPGSYYKGQFSGAFTMNGGGRSVRNRLPPSGSIKGSRGEMIIPDDVPAGDYFLCGVVDWWKDGGRVRESNEDNNIFCRGIQVVSDVTAQMGPLQEAQDAYGLGNYAEALKLFVPLAEGGDAEAQYFLSEMSLMGRGVPSDTEKWKEWLTRSADGGSIKAQYKLANHYFRGKYLEKDMTLAFKYFRKAAEQGFGPAQYHLGREYQQGWNVEKDLEEAYKWLSLAAENGENYARISLAQFYKDGVVVEQDIVQAYMWAELAGSFGPAGMARNEIGRGMTPEQKEQARKLAGEWLEKHGSSGK